MKKTTKVILIIAIIAILVVIAILINIEPSEKKTENNLINNYKVSSYDEKYEIESIVCDDLTEAEVQEITDKIFCANHNIGKTFKDISELTQKDLQLTVWFKKYKLENQKSCSEKEFSETLKNIYNIDFSKHESLENTLDYTNGSYKFKELKYREYQSPIIEKIQKSGKDIYMAIYTLTNPLSKRIVKYKATMQKENGNFYIKTITEYA